MTMGAGKWQQPRNRDRIDSGSSGHIDGGSSGRCRAVETPARKHQDNNDGNDRR
jgi:hypothetical protein